jgi:hypothetical protein
MFPMMFIEFPMVSSIKLCIAFIISVVKQMVSALEIASLDGCKAYNLSSTIHQLTKLLQHISQDILQDLKCQLINQKSHK